MFLEWLIKGKLNIFLYGDSVGHAHYFTQKEGDTLIELHNTQRVLNQEDLDKRTDNSNYKYRETSISGPYLFNRKEYIGELSYILRDCPELAPAIKNTGFDNGSLIKLAKKYHEKVCNSESCTVFEKPDTKLTYSIGLFSELYSSTLHTYYGIIEDETMNPGIFLNVSNFSSISPRFSVQIEFSYVNSKYKYYDYLINGYVDAYVMKQLRNVLLIKYSFPVSKIKFGIALGGTYYQRFSPYATDVKSGINYNYEDNYYSYTVRDYMNISKSQIGFDFQCGAEMKIYKAFYLQLNYRYEFCPNFIGFGYDQSYTNNTSIQFGIVYAINR